MGRGAGHDQKNTAITRRITERLKHSKVSAFLSQKFGMDDREKLALTGTVLAAPVAAIASPLIGLGVAGALVFPHLQKLAKDQKKRSASEALGIDPQTLHPAHQERAQEEQDEVASAHLAQEENLMVVTKQEWDRREQLLKDFALMLEDTRERVSELENAPTQESVSNTTQMAAVTKDPNHDKKKPSKRVQAQPTRGSRVSEQELLELLNPKGTYNREGYLASRKEARANQPDAYLMPSKLHWHEEILSGGMKYEFRRDGNNALKRLQPGSRVGLYASDEEGHGQMVGYFDCADVFEVTFENLDELWPKLEGNIGAGYGREEFEDYLASANGRLVVSEIANPQRMRKEVSAVEVLGGAVPGSRRLVSEKDAHSTLLGAMEANDADIVEERGVYHLSEGTAPTEQMKYRALASKFSGNDPFAYRALANLTEEDFLPLRAKYEKAWKQKVKEDKKKRREKKAAAAS